MEAVAALAMAKDIIAKKRFEDLLPLKGR